MKSITSTTRPAVAAALLAAVAMGSVHAESATLRIDARAPIAATLLPEVRVTPTRSADAIPATQIAATAALPVTLLPTVYVTAKADALTAVTLPTVHVVARAPAATTAPTREIATSLSPAPAAAWSSSPATSATRALPVEVMPR